jgi:transposase-like protein
MVKCPVCDREFQAEPLKTWRFRFYQVKRYQCILCGSKFNIYEGEKSRFVIFRVGRRRS